MKKLFLILCLSGGAILFSPNTVHAQMSLGITGGLFNQGSSFDGERISFNLFGLNIAGKYGFSDNKMRVGLNIGYYFDSESEDGETATYFTQPITALFEYSFTDNDFSPYAGIDAGIYRIGYSFDGESESESEIGFAPAVGCNYNVSDKVAINLNIKYNYILTEEIATTGINANAGVVINF